MDATTIPASSLANPSNPIPFAVLDRALVAICCGWNRRNDGNGIGYAPAWEEATLAELEALGFVKRERRPIGTDLVWMTEEGHGVIDDLVNEGSFDEHIAAVRHNL